jgi:hypothetical protein
VNAQFKKLVLVFFLLVTACSQEWREGDAGLSGDEMMSLLDEAQSGNAYADSGVTQALAYKTDPNTTIFFADAPGSMGPVPGVLALTDMSFLGSGGEQLSQYTVQAARIFFIDSPSLEDRQNGLVIGVTADGGAMKYYGFSGQGHVDGDLFEATLTGAAGTRVTLRSWDTDDGQLQDVIQLRVYEYDGAGNEIYIGKFTTLVGYGP